MIKWSVSFSSSSAMAREVFLKFCEERFLQGRGGNEIISKEKIYILFEVIAKAARGNKISLQSYSELSEGEYFQKCM